MQFLDNFNFLNVKNHCFSKCGNFMRFDKNPCLNSIFIPQMTNINTNFNNSGFLLNQGEFNFANINQTPLFNFSMNNFNYFSCLTTPILTSGLNVSPSHANNISCKLTPPSNSSTKPIIPSSGTYTQRVVQLAKNYEKQVKSRSYANQLFSGGQNRMWCSDFVGSVINDIYGNKVHGLPRMGCVKGIWDWGDKQKCNLTIYGMDSNKKGAYIAQNIKPGDIMINRTWYDKNKQGEKFDTPKHIFSHTEIVVEVHSDGSFKTVSGGGDSVRYVNHSPNEKNLYGFTCLNRYSA